MNHSCLESKRELEQHRLRIREIRKNVDSLTNEIVAHLNKINTLLKEIEKDSQTRNQSLAY